ncbi:MAG: thioredoxin-disulfide reductase [Rikenellaceae bacterium]|jgi:thioredoxin reductase (NADPH)|nr:thioredoxin-disulfide reductase [Rikenellaceae bacterium]
MNIEKIKCLIIGSGPAGLTAAIYASRANLAPTLYEGLDPGGQLTRTGDVENFPGYPEGVGGLQMMDDIRRQALRFGADVRTGIVTEADLSQRPFRITVDGSLTIEAQSVIIATGAAARWLGLPSEQRFVGSGVSACATCDGFFYRGQDVAVVGGGDTACEDALYLASLCRTVYMIVRKDYLRASSVMRDRVHGTPNITMLYRHVTVEVLGDESGVTGLDVEDTEGNRQRLDVTGLFVAIGNDPNTALFAGQLDLDEQGYIRTVPGTSRTSIPGVFAAGDVANPQYRQAVVAAGSGSVAALDCERFLLHGE